MLFGARLNTSQRTRLDERVLIARAVITPRSTCSSPSHAVTLVALSEADQQSFPSLPTRQPDQPDPIDRRSTTTEKQSEKKAIDDRAVSPKEEAVKQQFAMTSAAYNRYLLVPPPIIFREGTGCGLEV